MQFTRTMDQVNGIYYMRLHETAWIALSRGWHMPQDHVTDQIRNHACTDTSHVTRITNKGGHPRYIMQLPALSHCHNLHPWPAPSQDPRILNNCRTEASRLRKASNAHDCPPQQCPEGYALYRNKRLLGKPQTNNENIGCSEESTVEKDGWCYVG